MTENKRTATDVLLKLEADMIKMSQINQSLSFNLQIISNKLNKLISMLQVDVANENNSNDPKPFISGQPTSPLTQANITTSQIVLDEDLAPIGSRRHQRSESNIKPQVEFKDYENKNAPTPNTEENITELSKVLPKKSMQNEKIPLIQRVVDKNGKALFMAEIEILNTQSNITEYKTRTNGVGKWQASLSPGEYKVVVRKRGISTKDNIEVLQNLTVDTSINKELPTLIIK